MGDNNCVWFYTEFCEGDKKCNNYCTKFTHTSSPEGLEICDRWNYIVTEVLKQVRVEYSKDIGYEK